MDGQLLTERLLEYAKTFLHLDARDEEYMRNLLLSRFHLYAPYEGDADVFFGLRLPLNYWKFLF